MSAKEKNSNRPAAAERRSRLSALASDVPGLTRLALGKSGFAEADLISQWATIVGPDLARVAIPVKLRLPRPKAPAQDAGIAPNVPGGTLTLRTSPAASLEIQHQKPRILERIAAYFGYPLIADIRLEIGDRRRATPVKRKLSTGLSSSGPEPDLGQVADPDLRAVLQRLGAARRG